MLRHRVTRVYRKSVGGAVAELVEAPLFDRLRARADSFALYSGYYVPLQLLW